MFHETKAINNMASSFSALCSSDHHVWFSGNLIWTLCHWTTP